MSHLRAVIQGCGRIAGGFNEDRSESRALSHARAFELHPATRLVACCDSDPDTARSFALRWGCERWYTGASQMYTAENPDLVSVCVPTHAHLEAALEIVASPIPPAAILMEKPVADSLEAARTTAAAVRSTGALCNVNYLRRFVPELRDTVATLRSGELGEPRAFRALYTKGVANNGSHLIDLLRWMLGPMGEPLVVGEIDELEGDPTVSWVAEYGGIPGSVQGLREGDFSVFEVEVFCQRATVRVLDFGHRVEVSSVVDDAVFGGYRAMGPAAVRVTSLGDGVFHFVDNTISALRGDTDVLCPIEEAVAVMEDVQAIVERTSR